MKIIKKDFIELYAEKEKIELKEAKKRVESLIDLMVSNLQQDNTLIFRNFGSFTVKTTKRKAGRNPQTGEAIKFTPKKYIKFKVSSNVFKK